MGEWETEGLRPFIVRDVRETALLASERHNLDYSRGGRFLFSVFLIVLLGSTDLHIEPAVEMISGDVVVLS